MKKGFFGVIISLSGLITTATGYIVLYLIDGEGAPYGFCYFLMLLGVLTFSTGIMVVNDIEDDKKSK
jgi:4-hydroxybenzoate polyprenyltransferase